MLNQVLIEGYVADSYVYRKDLFVRIACYRDPTAPVKPAVHLGTNKEEPDYVYAKILNGFTDKLTFKEGTLLRIEGMITSRAYNETLEQFLEKAYKYNIPKDLSVEVVAGTPRQVVCGRNAVELLVKKFEVLEKINTGTLKTADRTIFKVNEMVNPGRKTRKAAANAAVSIKTVSPTAPSPSPVSVKPVSDAGQQKPPEKKKHKPTHRSQPKKNPTTTEKTVETTK